VNTALYDDAIKALARAAHGGGTLAQADVTVRLDNPYCGDRIDLSLVLSGSTIGALAHETKGCLLCRASASVIGLRAPGAGLAQVEQAIVALGALLAGGDLPAGAWNELELFRPVREYPARHGCVMLPLQALRKAIDHARMR
jgi:nitrogen fixation NifU-like protein